MREIKFRGKHYKTGKWICGMNFYKGKVFILHKGWCQYYYIGGLYDDENRVILETVGQYTGLIDKNGGEIYEGDILKFKDNRFGNLTGFVRYSGGEFIIDCPIEDEHYKNIIIKLACIDLQSCEVIGNIYENPDLIKREENQHEV